MKSQFSNQLRSHLWVGVACLCVSMSSHSSEDEHRHAASHVHGEGTIDVVVEGNELLVEIRMPAVNVVGFEHEPGTDEQRQTVETALAVFRDTRNVLVPSEAADCEPEDVDVTLGESSTHEDEHDHDEHAHEDEHDDDEHAHDEHAHEDEHGDDEHAHEEHAHEDEHDDEHAHEEHADEEEVHSELVGTYRFHCDRPAELKALGVPALDHLLDVEEILVQLITPTRQSALHLRPGGDQTVELE